MNIFAACIKPIFKYKVITVKGCIRLCISETKENRTLRICISDKLITPLEGLGASPRYELWGDAGLLITNNHLIYRKAHRLFNDIIGVAMLLYLITRNKDLHVN